MAFDTKDRHLVVAYGGGTNSSAFLIEFARLGIIPKLILFSDTGGERPATYLFIQQFSNWLVKHGMPPIITVIKGVKKGFPVETLEQNCIRKKMLPSIAYGYKTCSEKFKIRAQEKYVRHNPELKAILKTGVKLVKVIGYDAGEERRAKAYVHPQYEYWYPLIEWGWDRAKCVEVVKSAGFAPAKSSCFFCLGGDTEIFTDRGLKKIETLVDTEPTLLVPVLNGHYKDGAHGKNRYHTNGSWQKAPIRYFGDQEVFALDLVRGGVAKKTIQCTAEHRWILASGDERTTSALEQGDVLGLCQRQTIGTRNGNVPKPSPFGIAQGFTFGDGSRSQANRPVRLRFYGEKDKAMLRWFSSCALQKDKLPDGSFVPVAAELPNFWKDLPEVTENSSFLLGWFAGYFAADGSVTKTGSASIESAVERNLAFVRDVCHVLGVRCGRVQARLRNGYGGQSVLYRLTFTAGDLPLSFWLQEEHARRIELARPGRWPEKGRHWKVVAVRKTGIVAPVYCAQVDGVQRFALADHLVTGNCPSMTKPEIVQLSKEYPDLLARALAMEANAKDNLVTVKGLGRRFSWTEFIAKVKAGDPDACKWQGDVETPCGCFDG